MKAISLNWEHKVWSKFREDIRSHTASYLFLVILLTVAFFVRIYRLDQLLGFYYDQGRDALVVWNFWHYGKFFLIGPVTGLAGIFLGPFYYYLIAPFYLLGGGDPVFPAAFLAFLSVGAILIIFIIGRKMHSITAGVIAAVIASFSYYMVLAGRWLANPTPILLTSTLLLFAMWKVLDAKVQNSGRWWMVIAVVVGLSLQFESASAVFYIPVTLVFYVWVYLRNKKNLYVILPDSKTLGWCIFIFGLTLIPQIVFNFRHDNILVNNFIKVIITEKSFRLPLGDNLSIKRDFLWNVFTSKIFPGNIKPANIFYVGSLVGLILAFKKKAKEITLLLIFIGIPFLGYIFFQGNFGNIYDYYLTGYYMILVLLFSIGLAELTSGSIGKIVVVSFFIFFLNLNLGLLKNYFTQDIVRSSSIYLQNELQSVDWILDSGSREMKFNLNVYVPPVVPYTYDYLFTWQGNLKCGSGLCGLEKNETESSLYTLYEQDSQHSDRLNTWLSQQNGLGLLVDEQRFGGITVQKKLRL